MSFFSLIVSISTVLITTAASAQSLTTSNSKGSGGLVQATKDFYTEKAASRWLDGNYHDQSAIVNQLGCFPTGAQVPQAAANEWWALASNFGGLVPGNEWYSYLANYSGTLAAGQSFTISLRVCEGAGEQPFPQATIFYQKISGSRRLSGYLLDPNGQKKMLVEANSTGGDYNALLGGAQITEAAPGVWKFVITNTTRKPIEVYMGTFKMYLM